MALDFIGIGKARASYSKKNRGQKKRPLIERLSPNKQSGLYEEQALSQRNLALPEWGQALLDGARTVIEPIAETLTGVPQMGGSGKRSSMVSSMGGLPTENKPVAKMSSALSLVNDYNYTLSQIGLGLSIASIFYAPLAIASLVCVVLGAPEIIRRTYNQVFNDRKTTVDLLILATVVMGLGIGAGTILSGNIAFVFMISLNLFLANYAHRFMRQVREGAKSSLVDVFKQQPSVVWTRIDGVEMEVSVDTLQVGDIVVVNAGETIPIDGKITDGLASVDQHILTGESQPAEKGPGDEVFALTMVSSGKIDILVEKTGEETTAAQIGQVLNDTVNFKTGMQLWAEDMANTSVVPTLAISTVLLPFMPIVSWALLLIHPKYKGIVATYINILSYLDVASKEGILLKDGRMLEILNEVDTVVFDKTGTLTETQPHVGQVHSWSDDYTEEELLTYAAAAEYRQTHPLAHAIIEEAEARGLVIPEIEEAAYKVGYGLTVILNGATVRVGSLRFMQTEDLTLPPDSESTKEIAHGQGHSLIFIGIDDDVVGAIELEPTVRPEAEEIIQGLRERGIQHTYIISGDHEAPTRSLAKKLGIDHYFAETLPEDKADLIDQLQESGKTVCYIGDGINDAIALKKAAVSISLQGASSVAVDTAKVVLMDQSLSKLCTLFDLAAEFEQNMTKTFGLVIVPHLMSLAGLLFLHSGLLSVIILCQLGLGIGVGNALLPRLQHNWNAQKQLEDKSALEDGEKE